MMPVANILDPISDTLAPLIWQDPHSPEPTLKAQHAHWIKQHVYAVLEAAGYDNPHEWLSMVLTGSLTTYQYSDGSDVDISLFVNSQKLPEWSRAELIGLMIGKVDGTTLPGTPYPIQCFVVNKKLKPHDLYKKGLRAGYDIDTHRWIEPPDHERDHNVETQENGFYTYALMSADKMETLLKYEPDKAIDFWHQIHKRRMRDQTAGKGDFSESNIVFKFLSQRGLFPQISELSGEYIGKTGASWDPTVCEHCGGRMSDPKMVGTQWMNHCLNCGFWREVSRQSPLLQQQLQNWPPYPEALGDVGPERAWVARKIGGDYVEERAKAIEANLPASQWPKTHKDELLRMYALLSLTKGKKVTLEDVHDAWSAWKTDIVKDHDSLVPFDELDAETQKMDEPYAEAIRKASGRTSAYAPITQEEARGNSRPVSEDEFQQLAAEGHAQHNALIANASPTTGLDAHWPALKEHAWGQVQQPWGGATIDAHTGVPVESTANRYALTAKEPGYQTVSVPIGANRDQFHQAMEQAKQHFQPLLERQGHHLGVFRDDDEGRIDFDPTLVLDNLHDVDSIGAYTRAIGGAYNFADGNGYWPPHVAPQPQPALARTLSFKLGDPIPL